MKTLRELINDGNRRDDNIPTISQIAAAAFWAGQSDMRGKITAGIAAKFNEYKPGRYCHAETRAIRAVIDVPGINQNVLNNHPGADDGSGESAEIQSWAFDI